MFDAAGTAAAYLGAQIEEPLDIGQVVSFFGAVMSEQAVRTTAAMMAVAARILLRIIGKTPEERMRSAFRN